MVALWLVKGESLPDVLEQINVNILCVQETKGNGSEDKIGSEFKLLHYDVDRESNGAGVIVKEEYIKSG